MIPFGNGFRCVSSPAYRLNPPDVIEGSGSVARAVDYSLPPMSTGPGQISPGSSWNFQFWYRDPAGGGPGFNLTDGLQISFCP